LRRFGHDTMPRASLTVLDAVPQTFDNTGAEQGLTRTG